MKNRNKNSPTMTIGIDPSFREKGFGVCFYDRTRKTMRFQMFDGLIEFMFYLFSPDSPTVARCVIENSNLQKSTFDMKGNKFEVARKSRNVGCNQAVSQLTVEACRLKYGKVNVKEVSPKQKGKKWTAKEFSLVVKSEQIELKTKINNQDLRDAGKLALM